MTSLCLQLLSLAFIPELYIWTSGFTIRLLPKNTMRARILLFCRLFPDIKHLCSYGCAYCFPGMFLKSTCSQLKGRIIQRCHKWCSLMSVRTTKYCCSQSMTGWKSIIERSRLRVMEIKTERQQPFYLEEVHIPPRRSYGLTDRHLTCFHCGEKESIILHIEIKRMHDMEGNSMGCVKRQWPWRSALQPRL